jgi:Fe2+ or Zn2+ uptake regulation protein
MRAVTGTLLRDFNLRSTPNREEILDLFIEKNYALSHSDIEKEIDASLDRVTVYRTLKTFLDKGLIHKVLDDEGSFVDLQCACRRHLGCPLPIRDNSTAIRRTHDESHDVRQRTDWPVSGDS